MRRIIITITLICALAWPYSIIQAQQKSGKSSSPTSAAPALAHGGADNITAAQLKDYLTFIASDEMEGRDTPSRGLDTTALFIAMHLSRWGLKPAGDNGTFFQHIALRSSKVDTEKTRAEINGQSFNYGDGFLVHMNPGSASGSLVYVSHGLIIKSKNINPYQGIDVKDKIVIATTGLPKGVNNGDFSGKEGEDWDTVTGYAQKNGARGVIIIPNFQALAFWEPNRQNDVEHGDF